MWSREFFYFGAQRRHEYACSLKWEAVERKGQKQEREIKAAACTGVREGHRAHCPGAIEVSGASARPQGVNSSSSQPPSILGS